MKPKIDSINPSVMTVSEMANYLRVHPTTIYRLLKNGKIPAFRVGSDWRFNRERIDQWRMGSTIDA
jgi:excisionase family DNA binding protein